MGRMSSRFAEFGLVLLVAGCGGGGGGGGGSSIPEVPFSAFSAVQPNTTVVMSGGMSTTVTGSYVGTLPNITIQTMNPPVDDFNGASTQKLTYDANRALTGMAFSTPSGGASFNRGNSGTLWTCTIGVCGAQTSTGIAIVLDGVALPNGWNYQTFGVWGQATSATTLQAGVVSAGAITPASAVPTSGNANFIGVANGFFHEIVGGLGGLGYMTSASMAASVDFGAKTIGFSTSGTQLIPLNGTPAFARPGLDLNGNLVYNPSVNSFTGSVGTPAVGGVSVSGNATGRFYGPSAQELGGTFNLTGSGGTYIGGFGGKR